MQKPYHWLESLEMKEPQSAKDVFTIFPMVATETKERDYLTLEEALEQNLVFIPESGRVPELTVVVKGEKPVLIMEGEILVGGYQNRTVNISLLLDAGKEHYIPVSCVERGRWGARRRGFAGLLPETPSDRFISTSVMASSRLRRRKTATVINCYMQLNTPVADQRDVWEEVSRELLAAQVESPTEDAFEIYEHHRASIEDLLAPIKTLPNQVGAIFAIGRMIVAIEVFDHPDVWTIASKKILSGYAAEALELLWRGRVSQTVTADEAKAFRDMVSAALSRATIKPSPVGLGEHHLLNGGMVDGFALVHGGKVYHLFAFPRTHRL
ncbi:MAG: hypothetical protein RUDDFDWM_002015 [Candidatus Fervidibacterota bacterium]